MKIKVSFSEKNDMLKFKNLGKERKEAIATSYTDPIKFNYQTNNLVDIIHPKSCKAKIKEIINETWDSKTFILEPINHKEFPPFQAGQYIIVEINIDNVVYHRAYSLSSSPKNLKNYAITIKQVRNGFVSNYLLNNVKEQTNITIHGPFGTFTYQPLRDKPNILALAGGSGITPIMSMARAINDGVIDCNLTILYGAKEEKDLIFKKELDKLNKNNSKIKVQYVLSDEASTIYENGLIDKSLIEQYEIGKYSYFVCGPTNFYLHLNNIFKQLDIPNKYIRHGLFKIAEETLHHIEHQLTLITNDKTLTIPCYEDETLLSAIEKSSIYIPQKCMVGECGLCRSKLIDGKVKTTLDYVRMSDKKYHYLHPCVTYPLSDITLKLPK